MEDEGRNDDFGSRGDFGGPRKRNFRVKSDYFAPKPVKPGDEVEVEIEAVASKGDGVAKKDGFVIFIKGVKQGDKVKVKITDVKARFAIGEVVA
jgi:predicted RNA-binding protein with TRAM domain